MIEKEGFDPCCNRDFSGTNSGKLWISLEFSPPPPPPPPPPLANIFRKNRAPETQICPGPLNFSDRSCEWVHFVKYWLIIKLFCLKCHAIHSFIYSPSMLSWLKNYRYSFVIQLFRLRKYIFLLGSKFKNKNFLCDANIKTSCICRFQECMMPHIVINFNLGTRQISN